MRFCVVLTSFCVFATRIFCEAGDINANEDFYVAGVVEYHPIISNASMRESVEMNLKMYLKFIEEAKTKNVDILVFPEATLNYFGNPRNLLREEAASIPDPDKKISPADHPDEYHYLLVALSKAAKEKRIYILVNLIEKVPCTINPKICKLPYNTHTDGVSLYNTNIVFDRHGRIISRYRKINLFIESGIDRPLSEPLPVFETDFDVRFGHFICLDILYKDPAVLLLQQYNVTNFLFATHWFSVLPYFISVVLQQSFAIGNDVNLIAAGANKALTGSSGTGIYIGRHGFQHMVICPDPIQKLYTAKVPKRRGSDGSPVPELASNIECSSNMLKLEVGEYWADENPVVFPIDFSPPTICAGDDDICCTFDIKKKERPIPSGALAYRYALTVNYTKKVYAHALTLGEITCTIVTCTGKSPITCGRRFDGGKVVQATEFEHVKIKAKVKSDLFDDIVVMPSTVTTKLLPFDMSGYTFTSGAVFKDRRGTYKEFTIESKQKLPDFLSFGLLGRDFRLDK